MSTLSTLFGEESIQVMKLMQKMNEYEIECQYGGPTSFGRELVLCDSSGEVYTGLKEIKLHIERIKKSKRNS